MVKKLILSVALWAFEHAKTFIAMLVLLLALSVWSVTHLTFDMSNEGTLRSDNPVRMEYREFKETFGRDDYVLVVADLEKAKAKGLAFPQAYMALNQLQQAIEENVPYIEEVDSFSNIRYTFSNEEVLHTSNLMDVYSSKRWKDDADFLKFAAENQLYKNRFIADNQRYIALNIKFKSHITPAQDIDFLTVDNDTFVSNSNVQLEPIDNFKMAEALEKLFSEIDKSGLDAHVTGVPYLVDALNKLTITGSAITGSSAIILSMLLMWLFFRRLSAVFMPLLIMQISMLFALALKALFGVPYTLFTGVIVPLMIAIGISDAVHILAKFYKEYEQTGDKRLAVAHSVEFSAQAILLTSLTTSAGFLSFMIGDIESIAKLGVFTAVAVMTAFLLSVMLIPAILSLVNVKRQVKNTELFKSLDVFLEGCANFSIKYYKPIIISTIAVFILLAVNLVNLTFSHDNVAILQDNNKAKQDYYKVNEIFKAVNPIEILIDTKKDDGVFDLQLLKAMEAVENELAEKKINHVYFSQPYSIVSLIKEINMALQSNEAVHYVLPENINTIRQELNLFESSAKDDLFDVVDESFKVLRTTITLEDADGVAYHTLLPEIKALYEKHLPNGVEVTLTGNTALVAETVPSALRTMLKSYASALLVITIFIILIVRQLKLGLISIIPNVLPILVVMNLMIFTGWKLDLTTIMVGAIAIGIVVDDTLHFLHRYRENTLLGLSMELAIKDTMLTTGRALLITTIIYSIAASTNIFSPMPNFVIFGITLSLATALALLADIILTPAFIAGTNKGD